MIFLTGVNARDRGWRIRTESSGRTARQDDAGAGHRQHAEPHVGSIKIFGENPGNASHAIGYMPQSNAGFEATALSARRAAPRRFSRAKLGYSWTSQATRTEVTRVLQLDRCGPVCRPSLLAAFRRRRQRIMLAQALLDGPGFSSWTSALASLDPKIQSLPHRMHSSRCMQRERRREFCLVAHRHESLTARHWTRVPLLQGGRSAILGSSDEVVNTVRFLIFTVSRVESMPGRRAVFVVSQAREMSAELACHDGTELNN